jgi:hypothetical protein
MSEDFSAEIEKLLSKYGNDKCFECEAKNPAWISYPFSVVLCGKCAKKHKKTFSKPMSVISGEVDDFDDNLVKFLTVGGNERLTSFFKEYDIKINSCDESKYKTIAAAYYISLLKLEVDKLLNKDGVDVHLKNLINIKPNKEEGAKENKENKNFLMLSEENRELKKDFYSAASKIGGWFGYVGTSIKNAANAATEYTGLDKKLESAKSSINEGLEKIGLKKPIEKTGETVGTVISKTAEAVGTVGGKTIDKVSEIGIVNTAVEKTNEGYSAVKEGTEKVIDKIKPKSEEEEKKKEEEKK